ncbi:MAG: hypothetical protein V1787_01970 [Candidatus Micrarchaeota archaeon]
MREEARRVVVLLVLLVLGNIVWMLYAPNPYGSQEFLGRMIGITAALLLAPIVLAYWCWKGDPRGFSGASLYGILHASFLAVNYQMLLEAGAHNVYSPMLLVSAAIIGILLAYLGYSVKKRSPARG